MNPTPKHTPGPWIAELPVGLIRTQDGTPLATVFDNPDTGDEPPGEGQSAANATLIAKAPEMLAMLKECLPFLTAAWMQKEAVEKLIAEAEAA